MFWDCEQCNTKKLLGVSHRHCPNCGAVQDESKRYFPTDGEEVEIVNHKYYGIDWDCQYCSTPNSDKSNNCVNCGSSKEGTIEVDLVGQQKPKIRNIANNQKVEVKDTATKSSNYRKTLNHKIKENTTLSMSGKNKTLFGLLGVAITLIIGFLIYGFFKIENHTLTVNKKTWSRTVNIETYSSVRKSDWCSSMPYDAYSVSSIREVRSHTQVADGESCNNIKTDLGDGSYSSRRVCTTNYRSKPLYDNRCTYNVNRWRFSNSLLAQGNEDDKIYFPDSSQYTQKNGNFLGNTRLGTRSESYRVVFTYQDKKKVTTQCSFNQLKWQKFTINSMYVGRVRTIGGLICDDIINTPSNADFLKINLKK